MLPEFPKARHKMRDLWNQALFAGFHGGDPFLAEIPLRVQKEGDTAFVSGGEMEYKACAVEISLPVRDGEGMTLIEYVGTATKLGADMAKEQMKGVLEKMMQPTPYTMPLKFEEPLTFKQILDTWAKMEVRFDVDGKPIWPSITASPEIVAKLNERMPNWLQDPECVKQWTELVELKRKEFNEREARRRLVD